MVYVLCVVDTWVQCMFDVFCVSSTCSVCCEYGVMVSVWCMYVLCVVVTAGG